MSSQIVARMTSAIIGLGVGAALMYVVMKAQSNQGEVISPALKTASSVSASQLNPPQAASSVANAISKAVVVADDKQENKKNLASGEVPVAVIDGKAITLRQVEDTLLKQEGVQQLLEMLEKQYKVMDWSALSDRDVIVQTTTWRLTRVMMAAQLLKEKAGDAREDLIGIELAEQALAKQGVVVDEAVIANEVKRMEKRHYAALEARKQPYMDFRQFIEQTEKQPFNDYIHQPGFRMGAGIRVLVEKAASKDLSDDQLKEYFALHAENYRVQAAVELSDIYIPYSTSKGADGKERVSEEEKIRLDGVMNQLYQAIMKRQVSFERTFETFGKIYDQNADASGRLGFVNRDGTRPQKGARRIASRAMDEAFAVQPPFPVLLKPIASDSGIDLILVHSRRAGKEPTFADLHERLIADIVDGDLKNRTRRVLDDLRRAAVIDYRSLPPLIDQRVKEAGLPTIYSDPLPQSAP